MTTTTIFERTRLAGTCTAADVAGSVSDWKASPGDTAAAVVAGAYYAMTRSEEMLIVPGNSYGHKVYHIYEDANDAVKATAMAGRFPGYLALPNGEIWNGTIVIDRRVI